jgi:hypothetical protein
MGCAQSDEQVQEPVEKTEQPREIERKRSPTPDKEIADSGTLFGLMPTDANDVVEGHGEPMAAVAEQ